MMTLKLLLFAFSLAFNGPMPASNAPTTLETAPNFQFYTDSGELQQLSDHKGQVVYISFWASWCRPCLNNFQKYNSRREELQKMGVVLLNVSLDKDKASWKRALKNYPYLNGENVHVKDLKKVMDLYQLSSIPSYRYLNKNQELVSLNQGSDKGVIDAFKKWVDEPMENQP